jgi:hypothetical protein
MVKAVYKTRTDAAWFDLKDRARLRARGRCEYCGGAMIGHADLHHRWYSNSDSLRMLMYVHRRCHSHIHFGGELWAAAGSLAALGDRGKGDTDAWRQYLEERGQ